MKKIVLCSALWLTFGSSLAAPVNYANQLIHGALQRHPEVRTLTIRSLKPDHGVVASNARAATTPPTAPEAAVLAGRPSAQELSADGSQVTSVLPLVDMSGDQVGTLSVTANAGANPPAALATAAAVRDELSRHIINAVNLGDPIPYVAKPPRAPYAQQLVERTMAGHPELLVVALHVADLEGSDYPIIASSIGRIGKPADEDDLRVIRTGKPAAGAYGANKSRYGIELPMYDARGALIGALSVGYAYKAGDDEAGLLRAALAVESELRARIDSLAGLYAPAP